MRTKNVHWIKQVRGDCFGGMARQQCGASTLVFKKLNCKEKGKAVMVNMSVFRSCTPIDKERLGKKKKRTIL